MSILKSFDSCIYDFMGPFRYKGNVDIISFRRHNEWAYVLIITKLRYRQNQLLICSVYCGILQLEMNSRRKAVQNYKTVKEKAVELDVSLRHVQYLCKIGKIEGAIKRGGAWFIPDDTTIPIKNTKRDSCGFSFIGTKKKIFEKAIILFGENGFDAVSIQDIALSVGIRQSTIYNYFKSKREILDTIYSYYCFYSTKGRPTLEDLDPIIKNGSLLEIMQGVRYSVDKEYLQQVANINKIITQRVSFDKDANEIVKSLIIQGGTEFVEEVLIRAAELGRLELSNIYTLAIFVNSVAIYALFNGIVDQASENMTRVNEEEYAMYKYVADVSPELKPFLGEAADIP